MYRPRPVTGDTRRKEEKKLGALFYTSDVHAGHQLVAELRGFITIEEHELALQMRWNAIVAPEDTVWVTGDAALGERARTLGFFRRLNGTKHLVSGNHDKCWSGHRRSWLFHELYRTQFASVQDFARHQFGKRTVLLSHFPYTADHVEGKPRATQYRLRDEGEWLLHGHTHSSVRQTSAREIHVGLDAWDLAPVRQDRILAMIQAQEAKETPGAPASNLTV